MIRLKEFVVRVDHVQGCPRRGCGPECARVTDGWEADIRLRLPTGEPLRERVKVPVPGGRAAAMRWAQERESNLARNGKPKKEAKQAPPPASTLADFWPRWMEGYVEANREKPSSKATRHSTWKCHLQNTLGPLPLTAITNEEVQKLKGRLAKRSPKTVNNILTCLNTCLKTAVEWKVIPAMPCTIRLLKLAPPPIKFYEPEEYERLLEAARKVDDRIWVAALLGGDAGLRCGEILDLRWTDVDLRRGRLHVQRSNWHGEVTTPKSNRDRYIDMTKRLAAALQAFKHLRSPLVLCYYAGELGGPKKKPEAGSTLTRGWLWDKMKRSQRLAQLEENGKLHILRHTFGMRLASAGAAAQAIKELMGHRSLKTTERYMHLAKGGTRKAVSLLDPPEVRGDVGETKPVSPVGVSEIK